MATTFFFVVRFIGHAFIINSLIKQLGGIHMKILFCNIARMKYYKGIVAGVDEPQYGGEYVARTGDAYEKFNFAPLQEGTQQKCFGFLKRKVLMVHPAINCTLSVLNALREKLRKRNKS